MSRGLVVAFSVGALSVIVGVGLLLQGPGARELTVYSSLPLQGPQRTRSEDTIRGIRLALKHAGNKAGKFEVKYQSLDDSTTGARGWAPRAVIANALRAMEDDSTAVYIGELNSAASAVSIPILSHAKVPQISPTNTADGLTTDKHGADDGEPDKYYVHSFRNYARIVPRAKIQGEALATVMHEDGCERPAIIHDRELDGAGLARIVRRSMRQRHVRRVLDESIESRSRGYQRALAARVANQRADCVVFSGDTRSGAVGIFKELARALGPKARLYGSDGVADRAFTDVDRGGLPEGIATRVKLTLPAPGPDGFGEAGELFLTQFGQEYPDHSNPDPYAIYGYEAMRLALDAIERSGTAHRGDIVRALMNTKDRQSRIGKYSIDRNGDTTLTGYGLFAIQDGAPMFKRTIKASR